MQVKLASGELTREEYDAIQAKARSVWRAKLREEIALQKLERKGALEEKYGIEVGEGEYSALSQADRGIENCKACIFRYCDKLDAGEKYWRPTIKIVNGKAVIGKERCGRWQYYVNELCDRAGVPRKYIGKTLADYRVDGDNEDAVAMARWYVEEYPKCGLYLYGGAGTGKTMLASLITRELICAGREVIFGDVPSLLKRIKERFDAENRVAFDDNITAQMIQNRFMETEVLVLDDLGAGKLTDWSVGILYEIINERYNANRRTIVTSNFDLDNLGRRLNVRGAEYESERIVSRLTEMSEEGFFGTRDRRKEIRRYA